MLLRSTFTVLRLFCLSFAHQHLAIICHSSPHLLSSQALSGWMGADAHFQVSPEVYYWVQSQAVAGPLKEIHRGVFKRLLLCAQGHCPVGRWTFYPVWGSECSEVWTMFSLRLSLYFAALSVYSTPMSPSVPASEKHPHSMRLLPAHFTFGMVLCRC